MKKQSNGGLRGRAVPAKQFRPPAKKKGGY